MSTRYATFPSFTLAVESWMEDSVTLLDYYHNVHLEIYGPYFKPTNPVQDLMVKKNKNGLHERN